MGNMIYPDVNECKALIIDSNQTSRSIIASMLRDMGVVLITQTRGIVEARRALENSVFDIVLCEYHFDNSPESGQDLLGDLRRSQLMPYSTVFIMITGEASYQFVAEAAEAAMDSYLLKPHTSASLEQRLLQARHRKKVLKPIFDALERNELDRAAGLCIERFSSKGEFSLYCARIGAELLLKQNKSDFAKRLYIAVNEERPATTWSRLGIARAQLEENQIGLAKKTLVNLISEEPLYADAYDLLGQVQVELGELEAAMHTCRRATEITPYSITRLQKQGMLAYFMNEVDEAEQVFDRTVRLGISSKMFDSLTLVFLGFIQYDKREKKSFQRTYDNLALAAEQNLNNQRMQSFVGILSALKYVLERNPPAGIKTVSVLAAEIKMEHFDFESATNFISLISRLKNTEMLLPEADNWIKEVSDRFCTSKVSMEMLCKSSIKYKAYYNTIKSAYADIANMAETAMAHSAAGSPTEAVKLLMVYGKETLNSKLIDLAGMVLTKHETNIQNGEFLNQIISDLKLKFCKKANYVSLGGKVGRVAGGLNLRQRVEAE
jgi:CheY-like chemotaxis protein/Tfp pilus assembly protein PilF